MRKRTVIFCCFLLVFSLTLATAGGRKQTQGEKPLRFMLSNAYYTAPYCAPFNKLATETARALGVELTILDGNGNQQTQLEHANMAIVDGYDGFIYFPADVEGALPVIETLNRSGIAWIGVNAYPGDQIDKVGMKYYVGPDANSHALAARDYVFQKYPNGCNMVVIEGTAGHMQTIVMNAVLAQYPSKYVIIDRQDCNFQPELGMTKMTDMLTAYGISGRGGKIDLIYAQDPGSGMGAISALEAAGIKPGEVGFLACGSSKGVYDAIKAGWVSATSTQDPSAEGKLAVETMYAVIKGTATPGWTRLPTPIATIDTADQFYWF